MGGQSHRTEPRSLLKAGARDECPGWEITLDALKHPELDERLAPSSKVLRSAPSNLAFIAASPTCPLEAKAKIG